MTTVEDLQLQLKGLVLVRAILDYRGISDADLQRHSDEIRHSEAAELAAVVDPAPLPGRFGVPVFASLGELFTVYWSPLHSFLRRRGLSREDAEDLTQEFLLDLLRRNFLTGIDPRKGKFRSFLLASLEHFLSNDRAKKRRLKRGGGHRFFSLLADQAERRYLAEPAHDLTAEMLFEREWARTLIDQAA